MRLTLPLAALAAGSFGIGTTEFVIMGLLPQVASDLGVSIPDAGLLVTGYAAGVVIGAPILAVVTATWPKKATLMGLMGLFLLGNLLCALAPNYWVLLVARILTAFAHAAFFGIGAVVAAGLVAPGQRAQAMALMFAGLTVANILGVPGGTALGEAFGWRATFLAVSLIGAVAALGIALWVPKDSGRRGGDILGEFRVLTDGHVLIGMAMSAVSAAAFFSAFTYITPILRDVTGLSPDMVTWYLLVYGLGLTIGNFVGGRLADWRLLPSIIGIFVAVAAVMALFVLTSRSAPLALVTMVLWGIVSFAAVPPLQMRVMDAARAAPNLASTLNQGAFNIGCASGAWIGGLGIRAGLTLELLPLVGVALAGIAALLATLAWSTARRAAVPAQ